MAVHLFESGTWWAWIVKPFVAIDGVLDYLFAEYFGSVSVDDCAQTENLCCAFEVVSGQL